jgi:multidrug resistance protein, MATE family
MINRHSTMPSGPGRELGALLRLAWPMILAQLLQAGMGFVDTVMVGRVGPTDLAVVGIATNLWILVYLGSLGMLMSIMPIAAHHVGAGETSQLTRIFQQGLWYALAVGAAAFLAVRYIPGIAHYMSVDAEVLPGLDAYMDAIAWGMPAACLAMVPRFIAESSGHVKPMMLILAVMLPLNVLGNYALIYGNFGFPAMGATGAAWSTVIGMWLSAIAIHSWIFVTRKFPGIRPNATFRRPELSRILELFRLGLPISVSIVMETSLFAVVAVLMGTLGALPLAAHQVAINYATLMFMVPVGLTTAITVRVGQALGSGNHREARFRGRTGIAVAATFMFCSALVIWAFPAHIASMYTRDAAVLELAVGLLALAAVFQLFDGLQVAATGALRGYKDTARPMFLCLVSYWLIGFPLSWVAAFQLDLGPRGLWMGLVLGLVVAATLLTVRFERMAARRITASE